MRSPILNADDPVSVEMLSELNQPALTFGMKQPAEITAEIVEQYVNEQTFVLSAGDESVGVRTAIVGDHHVYNCLAAATMALAYGIELTTIARGLGSGRSACRAAWNASCAARILPCWSMRPIRPMHCELACERRDKRRAAA